MKPHTRAARHDKVAQGSSWPLSRAPAGALEGGRGGGAAVTVAPCPAKRPGGKTFAVLLMLCVEASCEYNRAVS